MTIADPIGKRSAHRAGPINRPSPTSEGAPEKLSVGAKFLVVLLFAYYALKPVYFFPSGAPQIADGVILLLAITIVFFGPILENPWHRSVVTAVFLFTLYAIVVNFAWSLIMNDLSITKHASYYTFNFLISYCTLRAFEVIGDKSTKILGTIVAVSLIFYAGMAQFATDFASDPAAGGRETLFFNNPNQLGYWALLSACILAACDRTARLSKVLTVTGYACAGLLCILSLSRGAMISFGMLMIMVCSRRWIYIVCAAAVAMPLVLLESEPEVVENVSVRFEKDDTVVARGYDRIWMYPQYLAFGAGEGYTNRLNVSHEFHSTLGTVLFSYGMIGFGLFALILYRLFKYSGASAMLFLTPAFVYGLTHQGLRFSILWVLIAILSLQRKGIVTLIR